MCKAGNRSSPQNVIARLAVPLVGEILAVGNSGGVWTTKRWPASFLTRNRTGRRLAITCTDNLTWWQYDSLPGGQPPAVIENHLSWLALI